MCRMFAEQDPGAYESETRSVRLNGHCTSIRLEAAFWTALDRIATREGLSTPQFLSRLHAEVIEHRGEAHNFTSLLRCACLLDAGLDSGRERGREAGRETARKTAPDAAPRIAAE